MISEVGVRLFKLIINGNRGGGDRKEKKKKQDVGVVSFGITSAKLNRRVKQPLCPRIAKQQQPNICVTSNEYRGTLFKVNIPSA